MILYLRFALLSLLVAFAAVLPAFSQENVDIFGYYFIEKSPRAFSDISEIHLAGDYGAKEKPPFYGLIRMTRKSAPDFRLLQPSLIDKQLTFKTKTVGGIHYEFSGYFTKLGNFPETRPEAQILLQGRLTKYRGKQKLASAELRFSYSAGD